MAPIDETMVEEARFVRDVLECSVVCLVCQRVTEADILHLEENVKLQETYVQTGPLESIHELDDQFHKYLFAIAHKQQVYDMIQNLAIHFDRIRNLALKGIGDLDIVEDHRKILEAIRSRDELQARQIMELHLNRCKVDSVSIREKYPHYFL